MSWILDSRATPNQAGIFAGRSLPKLPLVRFREHVARSSLSPFFEKVPPHIPWLSVFFPPSAPWMSPLFGSNEALAPSSMLHPVAFPRSPPFRPCAHSSPLPRILLGPTPRRRTRLPNTTSSRANTATHNFLKTRSHPHRRHPAS
jgi:hypothetical protein